LKRANEGTLCASLQMTTFFQTFRQQWALSPGASAATLCQFLHCQWLELLTIISYPRKFAECSYCDVSLPPILRLVSSHRVHLSHTVYTVIQVTIHTIIYSCNHTFIHSYIHTSIRSYNLTFILSHVHTFMHTRHIHNVIHTWLYQSPRVMFSRVFSVRFFNYHCVKPQVSTNEHLTFTFLSSKVSS
jgi:hypothetical protein